MQKLQNTFQENSKIFLSKTRKILAWTVVGQDAELANPVRIPGNFDFKKDNFQSL